MKRFQEKQTSPVKPQSQSTKKSKSETNLSENSDGHDDFMSATFATVGYQRAKKIHNKNTKNNEEESSSSVFRPDTRSKLSEGKKKVLEFIENYYEIPVDFETNRKFGSHSGLCHEDRLISAYEWKLLLPKKDFLMQHSTKKEWMICWKCSQIASHLGRQGCPQSNNLVIVDDERNC